MSALARRELLAGAAATAAALVTRPARAQSGLQTLRVSGTISDDLTPLLYAMKAGLFPKAGIDVQFTPLANGSAIAAAVVGGAIDIGKSSLVSLMAAHTRGIPIVLVAPGAVYSAKDPYTALVIAADATFKTGGDLNGKTIGVPAVGDFNTLVASLWVDQNGGDSKTLKFVEIPNAAQVPAVEEHRIDAAVIQQPDLSAALDSGKVKVLGDAYGALAPTFMFAGWFAMNAWATAHVDLVKSFADVMIAAARYTNTHHAETAPLLAEKTKIPLAVIQKMTRVDSALSLDPAMIQPIIDASAKYKMLSRAFPASELIFRP